MSGYYLLKNGEFAYNKSYSVGFDYGSIKRLDRYPMGALSTLYICFALTKHNSDFMKTYFDSLKWYKEIYMIAAEGARNHGLLNVPTEDFFDTVHVLPQSKSEQKKIAEFLLLLEDRIIKQEQLVNNLKLYKRGVLQRLFNADITEHSENNIGSLFKVTRGYVLPVSELREQPDREYCYPVYSSQTKNEGLMGFYNQYLYEDAITWTTDGANAGFVRFRKGKFYCTNVCGVLLSDEGFANEYIAEKLNSVTKRHVSYVGNPKLMNNVMAEIIIDYPSVELQKKYSSLVSQIDKKIQYETSVVEALTKTKAALLQQMFI